MGDKHSCHWRRTATKQAEQLRVQQAELDATKAELDATKEQFGAGFTAREN